MDSITDINQLDLTKSYTYADYLLWQFKERVELIKGKIFKMSPAPNLRHQRISVRIFTNIYSFLSGKSCEIFIAPFDVRLSTKNKNEEAATTVVQPDLCIVCDDRKLDTQGCIGAPDLIIEILFPGNSKKEMRGKYFLYEENEVKEYWVVIPDEEILQRYILDDQLKYVAQLPNVQGDIVGITFLPGFELSVDDIFTQ